MKIEIKVDAFEGPLDLLLHLITKDEIDIYDIPIVKVTNQYLKILDELPEMDLDMTTEFLVMASTLLEIKSKMLLPDTNADMETYDFSEEDPRRELVARLIEYKKFKEASNALRHRESSLDELVFKEQEELGLYVKATDMNTLNDDLEKELLIEAVQRLLTKADRFDHNRKSFFKGIKRDQFTVEEKIDFIETNLFQNSTVYFSNLFGSVKTREEIVVTFLAVLELLKMKRIAIQQSGLFEDIEIVRKIHEEDV